MTDDPKFTRRFILAAGGAAYMMGTFPGRPALAEAAQTLSLRLSHVSLVGGQGYTFEVRGVSEDLLNRGHFVHSIVGLEAELLDYLPVHAQGQGLPLGTAKFVQTGWFGGFAQLPVGTHTHRLEAWIDWRQEAPIVIEQVIEVRDPITYFNQWNEVFYLDLTQANRNIPWPGVPASVQAANKLNSMALVANALHPVKTGAMLLIRGSCPGFDVNPRGKYHGLYLTSYDGRATVNGSIEGLGESDFTNLRPFMVVEGLDFRGNGDVVSGSISATGSVIRNGVQNMTAVLSNTYAGITVENMAGIYPTGARTGGAEMVIFNSKITSWGDIGLYFLGRAAVCGNYICQDPQAMNGVEGKVAGAGNFPDHGPLRTPFADALAFNKNMAFSCNGWSAAYSAMPFPVMSHQPCLRINTAGDAGLRACVMGNFFEGMAATLGKGAASDGNYPAEILTFRHNIMLATSNTDVMLHVGTTNVFIADNLYVVPGVKRFSAGTVRFVSFGFSALSTTAGQAPIDASMYAGRIVIRNNTLLDQRQGVTDPLDQYLDAAVRGMTGQGVAADVADNALFVPNRAGGAVAPWAASYRQFGLEPQFWGLRQRYTVTTMNDREVADASYGTPKDALKIPVPGAAARDLAPLEAEKASLTDLIGARRTDATPGAVATDTNAIPLGALAGRGKRI